ncbi:MAG: gamma-glutamyltransferase family protein [Gemmatimonadota bacterium]
MLSTTRRATRVALLATLALLTTNAIPLAAQGRPNKPVLHGSNWVAITGKPLGATAGARIFHQGGNAVDAACAMLAATATMWDVLSWGGETQALIYNPETREVIGVNALGVAPSGATAEHYRSLGHDYPPQYGPLAAVTPGTPGGLMTMLAEFGTLSLADVLAPSIEMAEEGYPIEAQAAYSIEGNKRRIKQWRYSREVFLPHEGEEWEAPRPGELFKQPDLAATLRKLVDAEREALAAGKSREEAIYAAYDRFYRGDIAREFVRGANEEGGLFTEEDLANWQVYLEEPVHTNYRGYDVYKLTTWVQGPVMLQMLNMLEPFDLKSMGYNSARYIHTLYQVMNHAFADRDFYYGDPYFPPDEPVAGLLSKEYARARAEGIDPERNDPDVKPGNPYLFQEGDNPFLDYLERWHTTGVEGTGDVVPEHDRPSGGSGVDRSALGRDADRAGGAGGRAGDAAGVEPLLAFERDYWSGTTSVQAADADGWVVSITPSGGWIPAVVAGRTGVGMSQRAQSFVLNPAENPYNVIEPGKRPRATLTPALALEDGEPFLSFAVQGGDTQDQNLLQFFLNMVEFGMDVQEASEAANFNSYQLRNSFSDHESVPGRLLINEATSPWVREQLSRMGYSVTARDRTSGPINAIWFDREHGTMWGGSSDYGEDYGIAW